MKSKRNGDLELKRQTIIESSAVNDVEPENVLFSCVVQKINKYGHKLSRYMMVTEKRIYNMDKNVQKNGWKIKRCIDVQRVQAITVSKPSVAESNELIVHIEGDYDYRYAVPFFKSTLVNLLGQACQR